MNPWIGKEQRAQQARIHTAQMTKFNKNTLIKTK